MLFLILFNKIKDKGIYGWGYNQYQQIGSKSSNNLINEPIMIEYFKDNYESISLISGNQLFNYSSLPLWNQLNHLLFRISTRNEIKTILILCLLNILTNEPKYPQTLFWKIPKDILYLIFQYIAKQ